MAWRTAGSVLGTDISIGEIEAATLVTEAEGISSNDNDTTIPTSAAVKDYADTAIPAAEDASGINTGTATDQYVTADALAGSNLGTRYATIPITAVGQDVSTGDGKNYWESPAGFAGMNIVSATAYVVTAATGSGSQTIDIQLHNLTQGADVFSTKLTIDEDENSSSSAATAVVIDSGQDDITSGDVYRVDVDAVPGTTPGTTAWITIGCQLP